MSSGISMAMFTALPHIFYRKADRHVFPIRPAKAAGLRPRLSSPALRHRPRIKGRQCIRQSPMLRPRLLAAAGHFENKAEQLPADFFDSGVAGGDAAGVDIDQVVPLFGE